MQSSINDISDNIQNGAGSAAGSVVGPGCSSEVEALCSGESDGDGGDGGDDGEGDGRVRVRRLAGDDDDGGDEGDEGDDGDAVGDDYYDSQFACLQVRLCTLLLLFYSVVYARFTRSLLACTLFILYSFLFYLHHLTYL